MTPTMEKCAEAFKYWRAGHQARKKARAELHKKDWSKRTAKNLLKKLRTTGALLILLLWVGSSGASEIDLDIIAKIESNNTSYAYNPKTQATGLFQITPICLEEWNKYHYGNEYGMDALFDKSINFMIAQWYLEVRIPQMLKHFHKPITIENILIAYNAGIGRVVKGIMPSETRQYIIKYKKLAKGK